MPARPEATLWLFKEKWGFKNVPEPLAYDSYLKALLICANGDNELSQPERDWVVGYAAAYDTSEELIEELKTYKADEDIDAVISRERSVNASRRCLVYDAIKACSADGEYSSGERATVAKMAAKLGIDSEVLKQIEEIYAQEAKLREKRLALMYPTGAPL